MRLFYTIKNDMRYQVKYGFYFIYTLLTLLYILILRPITDPTIESLTGSLIMLSDPAVLGYFFIGGIWLLEKDEDLHSYIGITPLKTTEYVLSKIISLGVVSTLSATIIGAISLPLEHPFLLAVIVFLSSCFFTLVGLIFATFAKTVNGYLLTSVPPALLLLTPAILSVLGIEIPFTKLVPGTAVFKLINNILLNQTDGFFFYIIELLLWIGLTFWLALHFVRRGTGYGRRTKYAANT
ncbi:MAG: hypothetical protein ACLTXM_02000 [Enterococcus sp.]